MGKQQKEQKSSTNYRIIRALYVEPYSYEQLQKKTRIHRNTLKSRLNDLLDNKLILKKMYTLQHKNRFRGHYFYMLDWANEDVIQIISFHAKNETLSWYDINSLEINVYKKSFLILYEQVLTTSDFMNIISKLKSEEEKLWFQLVSTFNSNTHGYTDEAIEKRNELIEHRDRLLELLIYECTRFCFDRFYSLSKPLTPFSMLIFFKLLGLYTEWRPCVKFWEIMERMGKIRIVV